MLSSVAVRAGELLATMLAAGIVVLAAAVTGVWLSLIHISEPTRPY